MNKSEAYIKCREKLNSILNSIVQYYPDPKMIQLMLADYSNLSFEEFYVKMDMLKSLTSREMVMKNLTEHYSIDMSLIKEDHYALVSKIIALLWDIHG